MAGPENLAGAVGAPARYGLSARSGIWRHARAYASAPMAMAALGAFSAICLLTLPWTTDWYDVQTLAAARTPPALRPAVPDALFFREPESGTVPRVVFQAVSWCGHDDLGRSVLFRLMPGFLVSLAVGLLAAAVATVVGVLWGALAGLSGGALDRAMMRIVDVFYALPYILSVVLLKIALTDPLTAAFGGYAKPAGVIVLMLSIGGVSWLTMARVVRGQVLSLKTQAYVEAARAAGAGWFYILRRHLVPNMVGPILVYAALVVPLAMTQEAFLSFLGVGVPPPLPSLGRLAAEGVEAVNVFVGFWWMIVFPCGALFLALLALNVGADAVRDRLDPRSHRSAP